MENFETYRLDQTGQQTQAILDQVSTNTADIAQLRALYEALTQSEPVIIQPSDTWPVADPEENVIYRVIDRVNTPPQSYSDYMWNGTAMVLMATYNNAIDDEPTPGSNSLVKSGGVAASIVFDISAYHATGSTLATYANLAAALGTDGANVPASVRKGGMSVKFVKSSDNKYVQYFLTKDEWSANEADWQKTNLEEEVSQLVRTATAGPSEILKDYLTKRNGAYNTAVHIWQDMLKDYGFYTYFGVAIPEASLTISTGAKGTSIFLLKSLPIDNQDVDFAGTEADSLFEISANTTQNIVIPTAAAYYGITENVNVSVDCEFPQCSISKTGAEILNEKIKLLTDDVHRGLVQLDENTLKNSNGNVNKLTTNYLPGLLVDGIIDNRFPQYRTSDYIILDNFLYLAYNNIFPKNGGIQGVCFYDENKQFISYSSGLPSDETIINHGIIDLSEIPNAKFVRFSNSSPEFDINDSYVILSKTEDISIISYEDLSNSVDVSKSIGAFDTVTYGDTSDNVGYTEMGGTGDNIFTIENGYSTSTGIISKITVNVASAGTLTCFVGLLDQRRNMVNQREFTISIPQAGLNTIDISDKNIAIEEGEQIFIKSNRSAGMLPRWKGLSESIECQAMSAPSSGQGFTTYYEQSPTDFPYGISISLNYEVSIYEGRFAGKEEVSIVKNEVETLAEQVNLSGVVYDSDGHPFKIVVVNNQLVPKSLLYRKVVALGNSLTDHPYNSSLGWLTKDYAMAATKKEMSWTSQLEKRLKTYYADAQVIPFNIYQWEQNPAIDPSTIYKNDGISQNNIYLSEVLTSDVDCVIFRAGENNSTTPQTQQDYEDGLTSLINYIKQRCPAADIVISSLMWHNTMKDTAFMNVANTFGLKYVDTGVSGSQGETLGDFCLSYDNATYFPILHSGVAAHVNDYGFYIFANILLNAFGMAPLNEQHTISVESSVTYYINRVIGVKDGIITIQTYGNNAPTITVTDADSNVITVTHRSMSEYSLGSNPPTFCSTFIMPDSDITVTIS